MALIRRFQVPMVSLLELLLMVLTLRCRVPMAFRLVRPLRAIPPPLTGANGVPQGAPPQGPMPSRRSVFDHLQPPSGAHVHGIPTMQFA